MLNYIDKDNEEKIKLIKKQFLENTGYELDIENPKTFNEKLQWLKLFYRDSLLTKCADKYKVRDYIKDKIGEKYLIKLLGVYDSTEGIDFKKLPKKFVLKVNHGSGQNIICKDKRKLNLRETKSKLNQWLRPESNHYNLSYEWCYKDIKPKIICEEYIEQNDGNLLDYKILCFNGNPEYIWVDIDRFGRNRRRNFYDLSWNYFNNLELQYPKDDSYQVEKPEKLEEMLNIAKRLSEDFFHVRVDLYTISGKIYFGELTFYSGNGIEKFIPLEWDTKFGELINLPEKSLKSMIGLEKEFIKKEKKYGGMVVGVPRNKVSIHDHRTKEEISNGGMTGGDRMMHHKYAKKYAEYLLPIIEKKEPITLAEIGILKGTGLAVWCDFFIKGRVLGLDIDLGHTKDNMDNLKKRGAFSKNKPELYEFDQLINNIDYLETILKGDKIDVAIDDGLHSDESILKTIESVEPHLSKEFIYFIEDNRTVYRKIKRSFPDFDVRNYGELTILSRKKQEDVKRKVIYTCIVGGYDNIINHQYINDEWDYICFTDNIPENKDDFIWEFRSLEYSKKDNVRNNRWHKINPHILFPEYEYSIYLDSNIDILNDNFFQDIEKAIEDERVISLGPHFERRNIYDEFDVCKELGKDDIDIVEKQEKIIKKSGFSGEFGVFFENNIIFRKHNDKKVKKLMEDWWWWIENYSRRDQLSLAYVLWKNNFKIESLNKMSYRKNPNVNFVYNENHITKEELILQRENLYRKIFNLEQEIKKGNQEKLELNKSIRAKAQQVNLMKSSKFWRMREMYLYLKNGVKFVLFSPEKFIKKHIKSKK